MPRDQIQIFKQDDVWLTVWPTFGFQPDPTVLAYETWAEAYNSTQRGHLAGRDAASLERGRLLHFLDESARWTIGGQHA